MVLWKERGSLQEEKILCPENHPTFKNEEEADAYMERVVKAWVDERSV